MADRLREVIGDMTIEAFAALLEEKPQRIKDVLRGRQKIPEDMLLKLVERRQVDLNWLIGGIGKRDANLLSSREAALLNNYRSADVDGRSVIENTATLAAQPRAAYRVARKKAARFG